MWQLRHLLSRGWRSASGESALFRQPRNLRSRCRGQRFLYRLGRSHDSRYAGPRALYAGCGRRRRPGLVSPAGRRGRDSSQRSRSPCLAAHRLRRPGAVHARHAAVLQAQTADGVHRRSAPRSLCQRGGSSGEIMSKALFKGRDWITTQEWTDAELDVLLDVAGDLKRKFKVRVPHRYLADQTIFLMFFDKCTRTRNSFEAGMTQLGGHAHFLTADVMQVSHGESPKDTGIILSSYGHAIAIRHDLVPGEGNAYMREVAKWADAPVINMQCDVDHPCQTLADLMTIREQRGRNLRGLKIAVSWAYAPSYAKPLSVPQGLIMLMPRFGMDVTLAHPPEYNLMPETVEAARENARSAGTKFRVTDNMDEAFRDADVVIPKSWGCLDTMGSNPAESLRIAKQYTGWICHRERMQLARPDVLYMHPLPADRGNEVTDEVIDGPNSVVYQEAENRLHTAKSIMALTMSDLAIEYEA